ncbi:MAG: amino acid adenylation domain-containing protein, partial [Methylococcales bacterium]|nr:amino acid adenylation domain-containing protein [Methylococcales bacterium]
FGKIKKYCRQQGLTIPLLFKTIYGLVLSRYCRSQSDFIVFEPLAGRIRNHQKSIGCYYHQLPFIFPEHLLSADIPLKELYGYIKSFLRSLGNHRYISLFQQSQLIPASRIQFYYNFYSFKADLSLFGQASQMKVYHPLFLEDQVHLLVSTKQDDLVLNLLYNSAHFTDFELLERIASVALQLTENKQTIGEISFLLDNEVKYFDHLKIKKSEENTLSLAQHFSQIATKSPDAIAVSSEDKTLTYRQLDEQSNQLARLLKKQGIKSESLVGLCIGRGTELIISILAILKSGGAYVPLDPHYPKDRIKAITEDAEPEIILTQSWLIEKLPTDCAFLICWDQIQDELLATDSSSVNYHVAPDNTAYVIFTSGSTGQPKGVKICHQNVMRLFTSTQHWFNFNEQDVWCLFHSYAFDFSVWEIWGALFYGGKLVISPYITSRSPEEFLTLIEQEKITVLNQTPSAFNALIPLACEKQRPLSLKTIVFGGETLDMSKLLPWINLYGDQQPRLINMYGITETTVHATYQQITRSHIESSSGNPIGIPIPDCQVHIVDQYGQLQPPGIPGEMWISGAGVASGYLKRPELSVEKFKTASFANNPFVYCSGDLARYRLDGRLEYIGRIDEQIKARGFRIELGEIEAVLNEHLAINESVVALRQQSSDDPRIVAYLVLDDQIELTECLTDIRNFCKSQLAEYMVPSQYVAIDNIPLTNNGKVDRKALPEPEPINTEENYIAPETGLESQLGEIWSQLLGIKQIGRHQNFFEIGGHSLIATQLISRIKDQFTVELPLRVLFENPTIAELSDHLETSTANDLPCIEPIQKNQHMPLSFAQERLWFLDKMMTGNAAYNIPIAMRLRGQFSDEALSQTLSSIIKRHEILRTLFEEVDGKPIQKIGAYSSFFTLPVIDLSELDETDQQNEIKRIIQAESCHAFDLSEGPLFRAHLIYLANQDHILVMNMHHIVSDGWSLTVLMKEVADLCSVFGQKDATCLLPLSIQYSDFAYWQRQWLEGEVLNKQLSYWKKQLHQLAVLNIPTDYTRPTVQTFNGAQTTFEIPVELNQQIEAIAKQQNVTLYMLLLSVFITLLQRYSTQDDIAVGMPISGRNRSELEPLIGLFVNSLVIRAKCSGDTTFSELLTHVKETTLDAFANQDVPFEKLVESIKPARDTSRSPLFQVMFSVQNLPDFELRPDKVKVDVIEIESSFSKFDFSMELTESSHGIVGGVAYNTDLYHAETIERMVQHYISLLSGVCDNLSTKLHQLPLLNTIEQETLRNWSNSEVSLLGSGDVLHNLVTEQCQFMPKLVAVSFRGRTLNYKEIDQRSNQLAHFLQSKGARPNRLIGICMQRSFDLVISILAVLKSGSAYLPIDPEYPEHRIAYMLDDSRTSILLSQSKHQASLAQYEDELVLLDQQQELINQCDKTAVDSDVTEKDIAYVIYTSGSTGQPKGVMIPHRAIVNHMEWMSEEFPLHAGDKVLQKTPMSFDASVWEFFAPLMSGAQLVLAEPNGHKDPFYLVETVIKQEITTLQLVPTVLNIMLDIDDARQMNSLKRVFCGGESLTRELQSRFLETLSFASLYNLYGPTETTIDASWTQADKVVSSATVPIGRPIINTRIYVLDKYHQ